jgi:competence protein ComEA
MDATHHAPDADHFPPPAPSALAPRPADAEDLGGGRSPTPAERPGLRGSLARRVKESVWASVAAKASAVAVGMLGLAAIGAWSTLAGAGVPVVTTPIRASADAHGVWLAPMRSPALAASPGVSPSPADRAGSTPPTPSTAPAETSTAASRGVTTDGKVVLNEATVDDLVRLPRVGPKRAAAIVELRKRLGKFRKPTDLLRVRGIGRKTLTLMLPKLVVDAPVEPAK